MFKIADSKSRSIHSYSLKDVVDRADNCHENLGNIYQDMSRPQVFFVLCCDGFLEIEVDHSLPLRVVTVNSILDGTESDVQVTPCNATLTFDPTGAL